MEILVGLSREKVVVPKAKASVTLQGEGSLDTVLEWNDTASNVDLQGNPLMTYHSATVAIEGHGFVARNLTFKVIKLVDLEHTHSNKTSFCALKPHLIC